MRIIKYKKLSNGKYKILFDTTELILYEDVIIKNRLLLTKNIDLSLLEKIIEENKYYEAYNLSLKYIGKKMRSKNELKEYLMKLNFKEDLIEKVISDLSDKGYLSDKKYIEAFINDRFNLSKDGPYKIKKDLINMNFSEDLITETLNRIKIEEWANKLSNIIEKRVNLMKDKSLYMIKNKLKFELINLGYDINLIDNLLNNIDKNDSKAIEKDYKKALNKYSKKDKKDLKNTIKSYLYRKGYSVDDINNIINENE